MAGYVVDESGNQYYIHIGPEYTKDPKTNNVQKLPQIMQIAFHAFDQGQSNLILMRREMRPLAW